MRVILGIVTIVFCLTGCSELKVIGGAAIREMQADAVSVNWNKSERLQMAKAEEVSEVAPVKVRTFSAFRNYNKDKKRQVKGLWEQHGS